MVTLACPVPPSRNLATCRTNLIFFAVWRWIRSTALCRLTCRRFILWRTYLCRVFDFSEGIDDRYVDAAGRTVLTESCVYESRIMLGQSGNHGQFSPISLHGANTQMLDVYIDSVDEHFRHAQALGAEIVMAINDAPWGDRRYEVLDSAAHRWAFHQRIR